MDPAPPRGERRRAAGRSPRDLRGRRPAIRGPGGRGGAVRTGAEWTRGLVLAPVGIGDRPLGTLAVSGPGVDRFTPDDTQLLSSVGRQIGVAVGNARLYAATREREHEARVLYETIGRFGEL